MPTKTAPKSSSPRVVLPETEAVDQLTSQLNQAAAENEVLARRNAQLAGFQQEVQEARQTIVGLVAQVAALTAELEVATRVAAAARNDAANANAAKSVDADKVAHATALANAVKGLLG